MSKTYDILKTNEIHYTTYVADKHQIDQHNNLHLLDENYEDIVVFKNDQWNWFKIKIE